MKNIIKKSSFLIFAIIFTALFTFSVFAAEVKAGKDFFDAKEQPQKVCEILGIEANALESYCKDNNVTYLGVDKNNKRQIKALCYETDFSNSIVNISSMTSDNISVLIPQIVGIENAKGDVVTVGSQKFIKTAVMTEDSGGEYILTSFTTVADKKNFVLNFYTLKGEDTEYIDEIFEVYAQSKEFAVEKEQKFTLQRVLIFIGVVVFITVFVLVGITVIKDLRKPKEKTELKDSNNI